MRQDKEEEGHVSYSPDKMLLMNFNKQYGTSLKDSGCVSEQVQNAVSKGWLDRTTHVTGPALYRLTEAGESLLLGGTQHKTTLQHVAYLERGCPSLQHNESSAADIEKERGEVYGDPRMNHDRIAELWTALLRAKTGNTDLTLDAHVVALMMAGLKMVRAAQPFKFSKDSYDDGGIYFDFSLRFDDRQREGETK